MGNSRWRDRITWTGAGKGSRLTQHPQCAFRAELGVETRYGLLSSNEKLRLIREERPKSIIDWASQLGRCGDQLPFLFSEASAEFRDKVQAVEDRADDCYQLLRLLKRPRNLAAWALLTRMALGLERTLQEYGANSPRHRMAVINLDLCTCGFKFIAVHCKPESRLAEKYTWHGSIAQDAGDALDLCIKYNHFLNVFPCGIKITNRWTCSRKVRFGFISPGIRQGSARLLLTNTSFARPRRNIAPGVQCERPSRLTQRGCSANWSTRCAQQAYRENLALRENLGDASFYGDFDICGLRVHSFA